MSSHGRREARVFTVVLTVLFTPAVVFAVVPDTAAEQWAWIIVGAVVALILLIFLLSLVWNYLQ